MMEAPEPENVMANKKTPRKTRTRPPRESAANRRERAQEVYHLLTGTYPDARCALTHRTPFQLLVATILSAQTTDERVNMVTPELFEKYPAPADLAEAPQEEVEEVVRSTGFYRNKAKSIRGAARAVAEEHGGEVPDEMSELLKLPGVARKTANVVLGDAFGKAEGVVVDTHVRRLTQRLGFTAHEDPKKIEKDLMNLLPREQWTLCAHLLIWHGRQICTARKPMCSQCPLDEHCPKVGVQHPG